jgi:hypothetical protein
MRAGARAAATALIVVVMPGGQGDPGDRLGVARAAGAEGYAVGRPVQRQEARSQGQRPGLHRGLGASARGRDENPSGASATRELLLRFLRG